MVSFILLHQRTSSRKRRLRKSKRRERLTVLSLQASRSEGGRPDVPVVAVPAGVALGGPVVVRLTVLMEREGGGG